MLKGLIAITWLSLYSCSERGSRKPHSNQTTFRYYDFNLHVDLIDPFTGLENRMLILSGDEFYDEVTDSLYIVHNPKSESLYFIKYNANQSARENTQLKTRGDTTLVPLTKLQLDTVYTLASKFFCLDSNNISKDTIPPPPSGDSKIARVVLELKLRGDNYSRLIKKTGEQNFQSLYQYLLKQKNSQ